MEAATVVHTRQKSSSMDNLTVPAADQKSRPQSIGCDPSQGRPMLLEAGDPDRNGVHLIGYRQLQQHSHMGNNMRWHSDTNLALNPNQAESKLTVNKAEFDINDDSEGVTIHWDIKVNVSAKDWIGLYKTSETHPGKWLDYRNRGVSGCKKGELLWHFDRIASAFTEPETRVCFRYYHGNTGDLRAVTDSILVTNSLSSSSVGIGNFKRLYSVDSSADIVHLAIQDIEAVHVRKGMFFNPDPYVKIRVEPGQEAVTQPILTHHYKDTRTSVCENTTDPRWNSEIFHFMALPSDNLFMKVKDRFTTSRPTLLRFLGQVSVPVKQIMARARSGLTVTCQLMGRNPHDHVSGSIVFKPTLIPYDADRIMVNGENRREMTIDSVVEGALDRASADILTDSSLSSSDEENDSPLSAHSNNTTEVRALTHTYSGTSGDSSIDAALSRTQSIDNQVSSSTDTMNTVEISVSDSAITETQQESSTNEQSVPPVVFTDLIEDSIQESDDTAIVTNTDTPSPEQVNMSIPVMLSLPSLDSDAPASLQLDAERPVTPDMLSEYQRETDQHIQQQQQQQGVYDTESESIHHRIDSTSSEPGPPQYEEEDTSPQAQHHINLSTDEASGSLQPGEDSNKADGSHTASNDTVIINEKRQSIPPPDFPPPTLPEGHEYKSDDEPEACCDEASDPAADISAMPEGATGVQTNLTENSASHNMSPVSVVKSINKSSSVWSLENHAGSRENICDETQPPTQPQAHSLAEDLTLYINLSSGRRSNPPTPDASTAKEKRPLPTPRPKTLAEQLENLQVIESSVAPEYLPRPPDLPAKACKNARSSPSPGASNDPPRRMLMSEGSLEMPTSMAPLPPSGAKPKRSSHHKPNFEQVAEVYGALDQVDTKPKKARGSEQPPVLKPRKSKHEQPPQLPPRKQKGDGSSAPGAAGEADDVFETHHHTSRHHHRHHKTKVRHNQTPSTESEEARVASEVANAAASLPRPHQMKSESIEVEEALPVGWEARVDAHGRVFYIDHHDRVTTWQRPGQKRSANHQLQRVPSISNSDRRNMDHRYRNIQRMASVDTITERSERNMSPPRHHAPPPPGANSQSNHESGPQTNSRTSQPQSPTEGTASSSAPISGSTSQAKPTDAVTRNQKEAIRNSPAVKFLTRTDFFSLVQYSDDAQLAYTSNSALKHMVHKIRKDPMTFQKYWHNKDLVNFLNMFVNGEDELPANWQMKQDKTGKVFFLDHNTKTTTFIDPRLPVTQPPLTTGQVMPLARGRYRHEDGTEQSTTDTTTTTLPTAAEDDINPAAASAAAAAADLMPTAYNEKVVMFLRQPNILQVLQERYTMLKKNESLRNKINTIISDGTSALRKYRNHVELTVLLSMFENEIMSFVPAHLRSHQEHTSPKGSPVLGRRHAAPPHKRDFQEKYRTFLRKLEAKGIGQGPNKIKMRVRRDHILEDSFKKIMSYNKKDLQRNKLLISFLGEEGLDYGGPAREFFFLLSRELFNPYYGLFEYSANDTYTVQISPVSTFVDNAAEWFRFAGRMIGLCIVHQFLMDSFFTRPFYKMLLREICVLSDLESLDAEFHQSLLWIKDNDISEAGLDLTFSVDEEIFGQITERELKPNGMNIPVTNRNKKEYLEKMVTWRIDRGVTEQKEHLLRGFYEVIEPKLVSIFDAKDVELVIAGTAEIDVVDWRNNTEYRSGYYDTHPIIEWFWEIIQTFDNEKRLRLLQFVTGTSSIPFEGFNALRGSNGPRKFTIEKWGNSESLPRAHTCFNRLDLPTYTKKETMQDKLLLAISETSTFGIE